jgi:uncharacterized membrane protein YqhA
MRSFFNVLRIVMFTISSMVFLSGLILVAFACYEFLIVFIHLETGNPHETTLRVAIGLLSAIDMFLLATVFFVFSVGLLVLFRDPAAEIPVRLPEWLRIKSFMQLKVILWEAILTTLVIACLTGLATRRMKGEEFTVVLLTLPGIIFLISLSLYFLKKSENH